MEIFEGSPVFHPTLRESFKVYANNSLLDVVRYAGLKQLYSQHARYYQTARNLCMLSQPCAKHYKSCKSILSGIINHCEDIEVYESCEIMQSVRIIVSQCRLSEAVLSICYVGRIIASTGRVILNSRLINLFQIER